jgi:hypothetical protein
MSSPSPFPIVSTADYVGAIIPSECASATYPRVISHSAAGFWTPEPADVARVESAIRESLEGALSDPSLLSDLTAGGSANPEFATREIPKILVHFQEYRRQYVGVLESGRKTIWCNFFPESETREGDATNNWRTWYVVVMDGGFWYWAIECDVESLRCARFRSNGYA